MYLKPTALTDLAIPMNQNDQRTPTEISNRLERLKWRDEYTQLRLEFHKAMVARITYPRDHTKNEKIRNLLNDLHNGIKFNSGWSRLSEEIAQSARKHQAERTDDVARVWTETYFNTEVLQLNVWISLQIRKLLMFAEAGVDTVTALEACEAVHAKIITVVSRGATVDRITDALCDLMEGLQVRRGGRCGLRSK
jgi:hypothetical protein